MPHNRKKDYVIRGQSNKLDDFRKAAWRQCYAEGTCDFRRWLYVGRPELNEQGWGEGLVHAGRDGIVEAMRDAVWHIIASEKSKLGYCKTGLTFWFEYLDFLDATNRPVYELAEINQEVLKCYIHWLRNIKMAGTETGRLSYVSARNFYSHTKAVLQYLVRQQFLPEGLFPRNPFPNGNRAVKGTKPYTKKMMSALMRALYKDINGLRAGTLKLSASRTLTVYLLVIAARTGRNPGPLLELTRDAVVPHPIKPDRLSLLITYKHRGHTTSVQPFTNEIQIEDMTSLSVDALTLFNEVSTLTKPLSAEMAPELRDRLWLYRSENSRGAFAKGRVYVMNDRIYLDAAKAIAKRHNLLDENSKPLCLNISRLRKTFAQRMWHLTGGDIIATAQQLGNTPQNADQHYIAITPEMQANFRCLGHIMHADWAGKLDDVAFCEDLSRETGIPAQQLRSVAVGDNNTGVGRCTDPLYGGKAPGDGNPCTRWLECFNCPNQLIMEPDLYRLFSFYWLLLKERNFISLTRWKELYGKIILIIDHEIVEPNLRTKENPKGCFEPYRVQKFREEAENNPHPMWRDRSILGNNNVLV